MEVCKVGGARLTAKLGRATYVTDTGDLPPDPGAMSLLLLTKGMKLAQEAEGVWSWGGVGNLISLMVFPFLSLIEDRLWKKLVH